MSSPHINNWQDVQAEVLSRIHSRQWKPGDLIPNEAELAGEFGCARATVNRALQAVAGAGLLDRKRKAGTRVATNPVRKATLSIPIIRQEIEGRGHVYSYELLWSEIGPPQNDIKTKMEMEDDVNALHLSALHKADDRPYVVEERWINLLSVPDILDVDLSEMNANEWLVANAPFTAGDISFSARQADADTANKLGASVNDALFVIDRTTWNHRTAITSVCLTFHPGYRMTTLI